MKSVSVGQMSAEIGVVRTPCGNYRTACKVTYADGSFEEFKGPTLFSTLDAAEEHADILIESLRESQEKVQEQLS